MSIPTIFFKDGEEADKLGMVSKEQLVEKLESFK